MCKRGWTAPPHSGHLWCDSHVPPISACGSPCPVLYHLGESITIAIVINGSKLVRTADINRKCFLFISYKHSYRKLSYLRQEAEAAKDRDRTASRVFSASGSDLPLLQSITILILRWGPWILKGVRFSTGVRPAAWNMVCSAVCPAPCHQGWMNTLRKCFVRKAQKSGQFVTTAKKYRGL